MKQNVVSLGTLFAILFFSVPALHAEIVIEVPETNPAFSQEAKKAKTELKDQTQFFRDASDNWERYRNIYLDDSSEANLNNAVKFAKQTLNQAIDVWNQYYVLISTQLENGAGISDTDRQTLNDGIAAEQTWLQSQRVEISEAQTSQTISSVANSISEHLNEQGGFANSIVGLLSASRMNRAVSKLQAASDRSADFLVSLKAIGRDTTELDTLQAGLVETINEANGLTEEAETDFRVLSGSGSYLQYEEARLTLASAAEKAASAQATLQAIVTEYKKLKASGIVGAGSLSAEGDGQAVLSGKLNVSVNGSANVTLTDWSGAALVTTSGSGTTTTDGNRVTYSGWDSLTIEGSDIHLFIGGNFTELAANGEGRAFLSGSGTFITASGGAESFDLANGVVYNIAT
ncbi:MAG: hypothetical protein Q8Q20_02230 [bacterium]|nr:hypothetical protein [bacterium]